ncbi:hypothetical protein HKD37_18G049700 [Glycine soja]
MAASHGCLYPYSGHAITHHPTQIRLLALCGSRIPWFPSSVQPPPPSSLPPVIDFTSTQHRLLSLFSTTALQTVPPSMYPTMPTAMLEHRNTRTSSSAQPPPTTKPMSTPSSSAQPPPTAAPTSTTPPLSHPWLRCRFPAFIRPTATSNSVVCCPYHSTLPTVITATTIAAKSLMAMTPSCSATMPSSIIFIHAWFGFFSPSRLGFAPSVIGDDVRRHHIHHHHRSHRLNHNHGWHRLSFWFTHVLFYAPNTLRTRCF